MTLASLYEYFNEFIYGKGDEQWQRSSYLQKKGYEERVALLEHLKSRIEEKEVAEKVKRKQREQGDLSENAEIRCS